MVRLFFEPPLLAAQAPRARIPALPPPPRVYKWRSAARRLTSHRRKPSSLPSLHSTAPPPEPPQPAIRRRPPIHLCSAPQPKVRMGDEPPRHPLSFPALTVRRRARGAGRVPPPEAPPPHCLCSECEQGRKKGILPLTPYPSSFSTEPPFSILSLLSSK
jgi:hypothetical protein